jgi:hypothetical protein
MENVPLPEWAPEGQGRVRTYFCYWDETGISQRYFSAAKQAGPLATFEGADTWVERPYADGVALLGDAAANSDPSWGKASRLLCAVLVSVGTAGDVPVPAAE